MPKNKINILDDILADDYTELTGFQNTARYDYSKKLTQLRSAVSYCYINLETYYELKNQLDNNAIKRGIKLLKKEPTPQRKKINKLFFDNLDKINELQEQGYSNSQIYDILCQIDDRFKDIDLYMMTNTITQATLTSNKPMKKYDIYIDEIKILLKDGNTAYFIAKYLSKKYPNDDISFSSIIQYIDKLKKQME